MVTGVVRHGRLLAVPLLLKLDVAQLENSGHHLQHPCSEGEEGRWCILFLVLFLSFSFIFLIELKEN